MNDVTETFNTVYDATFRDLMRYCLLKVPLSDAHDLLQTAYAQFYRVLCRKGIAAIRDPKAYLLTVLKHEIGSFYRSRAKRKELPLEEVFDEPSDGFSDELTLDRLTVDEIFARIGDEPEPTQRMFLLYYGYGMKLGDIAQEMGTTVAGVKSRLVRLRRKLKASYEEENCL